MKLPKNFTDNTVSPKSVIESLPSPGSTLGNAQAVAEWLTRHEDISEIEIVTNRSHMLRAWRMFVSVLYEQQFGTPPHFSETVIENIEKVLKETLPEAAHGDDRALTAVQNIFLPLLRACTFQSSPP